MPKTEDDPLGPHFAWRLRAELDRIQPRFSSPRYLSAGARLRVGAWRFAPVALAIGATSILGLTAWAATGSTNPAVWTERMTTVMHTVPSPTPESTPAPPKSQALPPPAPVRETPKEASGQPEPSNTAGTRESPEPPGDHSGSGTSVASGSRTSTPSPYPSDH